MLNFYQINLNTAQNIFFIFVNLSDGLKKIKFEELDNVYLVDIVTAESASPSSPIKFPYASPN